MTLEKKGIISSKHFKDQPMILYKNTQMGGVALIFIKEFDTYRKDRK